MISAAVPKSAFQVRIFAPTTSHASPRIGATATSTTDGGVTWSSLRKVNADVGLDHYFAAIDVVPYRSDEGKDHVGVSYFRSERVPNENVTAVFDPSQPGVQGKNSDYVLAGGTAPFTPFVFDVLSPVFPPPDGIQAGFNGDYSGLTIVNENAHPIWSDNAQRRSVCPDQRCDPRRGCLHNQTQRPEWSRGTERR